MPFRVRPWNWLQTRRLRSHLSRIADEHAAPQPRKSYRPPCKYYGFIRPVVAATAVLLCAASSVTAQTSSADVQPRTHDLQRVVDALRDRMGIVDAVQVTVVDRDARTVSVRRSQETGGGFALSAERGFIAALPPDQVEAALAHELGHVWIYTHHPYLQTEQLANRVAMRVVSRDRLVEVYRVLWGADAVHGSLEAFLGVEAAR